MVRTITTDRKSKKKKNRLTASGLEQLESRRLMAAVDSFSLINADTDKTIMTLTSGSTINLATLPTTNLNVRANATGKPESVRFSLDQWADFYTDNNAAFAMARNRGSDYLAWNFTVGSHGLSAYPYEGDDATGKRGVRLTVLFNVINEPVNNNNPNQSNGQYALTVSKSTANAADNMTGTWTAPSGAGSTDWVGLYRVGASNENYLWWDYTDGATSGTVNFLAPSSGGQYELRYLLNDKTEVVKATSSSFTVNAPTNNNPTPTNGAMPDGTNTGPTNRSVLQTINGVLTITQPGVYENFDVTGGISIYASNVTLRNFVSRDNIKVYSGTNILMEDGEVYSNTGSDGISGANMTLRRLNLHNLHDGVRIGSDGNTTIEGCWIHDLGTSAGHTDGVQVLQDVPNVNIIGNRWQMGNCTSALNGVGGGWHVEGNWFEGAQYAMYCYSYGTPTVVNNYFSDVRLGAARFWPSSGIWSGNVNTDTGQTI